MANFLSFLLTLVFMVVYGLVGGAILMLLERNTEKEFKEASNETIHNIIGLQPFHSSNLDHTCVLCDVTGCLFSY